MPSRTQGFTLIELIVAVSIIGILMGLGIPAYRQYVQRANRVDATSALLRLSSNQERFYLQNNTYATEAQRPLAPPNGLGVAATERGYYTLVLAAGAGGWAQGYTATATAIAGGQGNQATDTACRTFTVNERGVRSAQTSGGADNTATCWR